MLCSAEQALHPTSQGGMTGGHEGEGLLSGGPLAYGTPSQEMLAWLRLLWPFGGL